MINLSTIQLTGTLKGFLDVEDDTIIPITYSLGDIRDLSKKNGTFSKSIKIKGTKNNNTLLNHYYDINVVAGTFNINTLTPCTILQNNIPILDNAVLQLISVDKVQYGNNNDEQIEYTILIKDGTADFFTIINNRYLEDLNLAIPTKNYSASAVTASFNNTVTDGFKYMMCFNPSDADGETIFNLEEFKPAVYAKKYFDSIFQAAGYRYKWLSKDNSDFNFSKLLIPFNGEFKSDSIIQTTQVQTNASANLINVNKYHNDGFGGNNLSIVSGDPIKTNFSSVVTDPNSLLNLTNDEFSVFNLPSNENQIKFTITYDVEVKVNNPTASNMYLGVYYHGNNTFFNTGSLGVDTYINLKKSNGAQMSQVSALDNKISIQHGGSYNPGVTSVKPKVTLTKTLNIQGSFTNETFSLWTQGSFVTNGDVNVVAGSTLGILQTDMAFGFYKQSDNSFISNATISVEITNLTVKYESQVTGNYGYNTQINMNDFIPKKIKQSDFMKSIFTMFNLYTEVDKDDKRLINIFGRNEYYDSGATKDWTHKIVKDKPQTLAFLPELTNKKLILTYKQDSDTTNQIYFTSTNEVYGQQEFVFDNQYVKDINKTEIIFSPTPVHNCSFGAILPMLNGTAPNCNIRIMYDAGSFPCKVYKINDFITQAGVSATTSYSSYPHISHFNHPTDPTFDLNFGQCDYYFRDDAFFKTNNNLFNLHWRRTMNQINSGKMLTALISLNETDINNMRLNDKIFIGNAYWNINRVIDYNANSNDPTKVELISIDDNLQFPFTIRTNKLITDSTPLLTRATWNLWNIRQPYVNILNSNTFGNVSGMNNFLTNGGGIVRIDGFNNTLNGSGSIFGSWNTLLNGGHVLGSGNILQSVRPFVVGDTNFLSSGITRPFILGTGNILSSGLTNPYVFGNGNFIPSGIDNAHILGHNITATTSNALHIPNLVIPAGGTINGTPISVISNAVTADTYVTAFTYNTGTYDLNIKQNNNSSFIANLSSLASSVTITGGTYNPANGSITFVNNSGGSFVVSGITTGITDTYVTGGTYNPNGSILFTRNNANTFSVTGLYTGTSGVIFGVGTTNYLPKWTSTTGQGISLLYDDGSNLGLGTTTPYNIGGSVKGLTLNNNATTSGGLLFSIADSMKMQQFVDSDSMFSLQASSGIGIKMFTNGAEKMRINTAGNVLIGTTTDNGQKLQVQGSLVATSIIKSGGTSSQFLKADGSIDSSTYISSETDTLSTVVGRGNTTPLAITTTGFIKSGGTSVQFLKADGSVDNNLYITSYVDTYSTAVTYSNNVITVKRNQGQSDMSILINTMTGLTVTGSINGGTFIKNNAIHFPYSAIGNSDIVIGGRNGGGTPFIGTNTNATTLTGMYFAAIQASDVPRTGESDILFKTGINSTDTVATITSAGSAYGFYNSTTPLVNIQRNGNTLIGTVGDNGTDKLQVNGSLIANTIKKSGGTSSQFLKADGSVDSTAYYPASNPSGFSSTIGTVTNVSALTLGTSGTDLSSSVANATTTPVITLNVPTASASNRGALSSTDWSTFNNKQNALGYTPVNQTRLINTTSPLAGGGDLTADRTLTISQSNTSTNGYLSSTDWNTFNNKTNTATTITTTAPLTGGGNLSSNRTFAITQATISTDGYLSSTDWNIFNNKQNTIANAITGSGVVNVITKWSGTSGITTSNITDTGALITLNSNVNMSGTVAVSSSVQVGNNASVASASNAGALRYRSDSNNSYVDMAMQTGTTSYGWINIIHNVF